MLPALVLAFLLLLAGCGLVRVPDLTAAVEQAYAVNSSYLYYHSYGDSITAGYELASPKTQAYPYLIAAHNVLKLTDLAIPGDQACDVPTRQIFPNSDDPTLAVKSLYSLLISTNDLAEGTGAYESVFNACQQATVAWLAVPLESKVLASSAGVTTTGATHQEKTNHWNAEVTDAPGATIQFPLVRSVSGPVYVWYRMVDGNPGSFRYLVDGTAAGSATTQGETTIATYNGSKDSLGLIRIASVPSGTHVLTFEQTGGGANGMGIVGIGTPSVSTEGDLPLVLVGTTPRQLVNGGGECAISTVICDAYIADITANVAIFKHDGLNVQLFESRKYETGTVADMSDGLHPNALGHLELFRSVEDAMK